MLPIRDTIHSRSFPIVNYAIIGLNTAIFLFEISMPDRMLQQFISIFGMVPARLPLFEPWRFFVFPVGNHFLVYAHVLTRRLGAFFEQYVDFVHFWR
jgi:membrane associated rhomboid family serine protease